MELIGTALSVFPEDWHWLVAATGLAGLVRGFAGFGTAMIFLPLVGIVLPPFAALSMLLVVDLVGPIPTIPRAMRDGHVPDILRLALGAMLAVPLGVFVLTIIPPEGFRWAVSVVSLILLVLLILGVRYRGPMTPPLIYATGALGGALTGAVGVPGPPVIMLYMASDRPISAIRANLSMYLVAADLILAVVLWSSGLLVHEALLMGAILLPVFILANLTGAAIFSPNHAGSYRIIAYIIIAGSAILGLPVWS